MKLSKLLLLPLIGLCVSGCDMIDYHPYDVRISGQTNLIRPAIKEKLGSPKMAR